MNVVDGSRIYFRMRTENACGILGEWSESLVYENQPVDGDVFFVKQGNESILGDGFINVIPSTDPTTTPTPTPTPSPFEDGAFEAALQGGRL